jgi:hypothetical protein
MEEALGLVQGPEQNQLRQRVQASLELVLCYAQRDVAAFLKVAPQTPDFSPFGPALLQGKLQEAARLVAPENDKALVQHALLYLAALKAGNKKLAEEQWQALLTSLSKGGPRLRKFGEMLAGRRLNQDQARRLAIEPDQKRVLLAVMAKRYPESGKELLELARRLDFSPDLTSLCLRQVLE